MAPETVAPDIEATTLDAGFRLMRLEVSNWGPFRQGVTSMCPDGRHAVLTGNLGPGTSALVEALRMLLLPAPNPAITPHATDRPAMLLGVFHNAAFDRTVTLAQIFPSAADQPLPARLFVAAPHELSIGGDLSHFDGDLVALRKSLRTVGAESFDTFARYHAWFRRCFTIGDPLPVEALRACRDALDGYFASLKLALLEVRLGQLADDWARHDRRVLDEVERHAALRAQALHLRHSISASGGERIAQLDIDIEQLERVRDIRRQRATLYATLIASVNEAPAATEADFLAQRERLAARRAHAPSAALSQLSAFLDFHEIDWHMPARDAARLGEEKQRLQNASDILQQLADGLEELRGTIRSCEQSLDACRDARTAAQTAMAIAETERQQAEDLLAASEPAMQSASLDMLDALRAEAFGQHAPTVESCDPCRESMRRWLQARIDADARDWALLDEQLRDAPSALATAEAARPYRFHLAVLDESFWRGDDDTTRNWLQRLGAANVQCLIVTPMEKIPIVEPMVSSVAFVRYEGDAAARVWRVAIGNV
ncbi:ATP-binding protein [Cupriavidus campinensis]